MVIRQNDLKTVEEVTNYCKAGGGCGGCHGQIEKIIEEIQGQKIKELRTAPKVKRKKLTNIQKIPLIQQTMREQVRPAMRAHGGDIELVDVEGDKVIVAFRGMCSRCKLADYTLKEVVEAKLREFVSDSLFVEEDRESLDPDHRHQEE